MEIKDLSYNTPAEKTQSSIANLLSFMNKDIHIGGKTIPDKIKLYFYQELSMLLGAGLDIKKSLETIVEEQKKETYKNAFEHITQKVIQGMSLSKALESENGFSPYEYYTIQIGEETGKLADVLAQLSQFYDKKIQQRRKVVGALSYPIIVLGIAIVAVIFFLTFLIPMFMDVFTRFDADLPALTQFVVNISNSFSNNALTIVIVLLLIISLFIIKRKSEKMQLIFAKIILKIPYFNNLVQLSHLATFSQTLQLLIGANTPLSRALFLCKQMTSFKYFQNILDDVEQNVLHGELLHRALQKHTFFPKRMVYLVKTGEEINKLEEIFAQLNTQYSKELEHKTSLMSTVLEPLLIIFVGALVAVILIAMYLPMFELGSAIY